MDQLQTQLCPFKKGTLAKDQHEAIVLVNDNGGAFSTNEAILVIWQLCDGEKTIAEICSELKKHSNDEDFDEKVLLIFGKLKNAELIDFRED